MELRPIAIIFGQFRKVTRDTLMNWLRKDPNRYEVGATFEDEMSPEALNDNPVYSFKYIYYAKTRSNSDIRAWENAALSLLPADHPYNDSKTSNMPEGAQGFLYIVDMPGS